MVLLAVYRPPQSDVWDILKELEGLVAESGGPMLMIIEDINIDVTKGSRMAEKYLQSLSKNGCPYIIEGYTRAELRENN